MSRHDAWYFRLSIVEDGSSDEEWAASDDWLSWGDDVESDEESLFRTVSDFKFRLSLMKPRLGNPRNELAAWCNEFIPKTRLARDGCFYTKAEFLEYHGVDDGAWCWDIAKRVNIKEYWGLNDFEIKALHDFLLRVLRVENDFRRAWRVLNHRDVIVKLGYCIQRLIASFLTADIAVFIHSTFPIEWCCWKLPALF